VRITTLAANDWKTQPIAQGGNLIHQQIWPRVAVDGEEIDAAVVVDIALSQATARVYQGLCNPAVR
jgi:hypothetical protein